MTDLSRLCGGAARPSSFLCRVLLLTIVIMQSALSAEPEVNFTFEKLLKQAFEKNLGLKIEIEKTHQQKASEQAAFRRLLPLASISSGRSETLYDSQSQEGELTSYSSSVTISQPLYQPALWANWKKSELNKNNADYSLLRKQQSLLFEVKKAWFKLLEEQLLYSETQASLLRLQQHQKNAEAFYRNGKIWRNDVLQAQVRVAKGEQDMFASSNRVTLAKSTINLILDREVTSALSPQGRLTWISFTKTLKPLFSQATNDRIELKQSQVGINLAKQDVALASAKLKPTANFTLTSGAYSEHFGYQRSVKDTVASLTLRWDFWQWGQTNREVASARANVQVQHLSLAQLKAAVMAEVQSAYLTVVESQKSFKVSEQALSQAKENYKVSQIRYTEQLGSSTDVLDAQDLLTQTRNSRTSALARYLTAIAELNLATGQGVADTSVSPTRK
jgi:outer membrane protein TolC|tara:strand:- start:55 stop:1395 length:1341 start_codon:yes stop_codon:yes gene_type:complete